jgi:hypothetical protein
MGTSKWIPGVAVLLAAQVGAIAVGCGDAEPDDGGGSGGALGGSSGSGGHTDGSGGHTGGMGPGGAGGSPVTCDGTTSLGGSCGACELSVANYCSGHDCDLPQELEFCWGSLGYLTSSGCGYHRVEHKNGNLDPVPLSLDIWDQDSGELVFHYSRDADAEACQPDVVVGEEPECSTYSEICNSGYACPLPPHTECHGSCFQGCAGSFSCGELEALCLAGQGGEGGLGGGPP